MENILFLFDLDGVVFDTEGQYSLFWNRVGEKYKGDSDFAMKIKGQTLPEIFSRHFAGNAPLQRELTDGINDFERNMSYEYITGAKEFIETVAASGMPRAIVTSSNRAKMENVYRARPEILKLFDRIFTGEDFTRSKPAPDCYLKGMGEFGVSAGHTLIFEDSISGLQAAKDSGGNVIGVATTNPGNAIAPYAGLVTDDFKGISIEMLRNAFKI